MNMMESDTGQPTTIAPNKRLNLFACSVINRRKPSRMPGSEIVAVIMVDLWDFNDAIFLSFP